MEKYLKWWKSRGNKKYSLCLYFQSIVIKIIIRLCVVQTKGTRQHPGTTVNKKTAIIYRICGSGRLCGVVICSNCMFSLVIFLDKRSLKNVIQGE